MLVDYYQMSDALHRLVRRLPRFDYRTTPRQLPENGIYAFFEHGEVAGRRGVWTDRIVRVGTHREDGRLRTRIRQHYGHIRSLGGNKNSSVFRKHLGGALLRRSNPQDPRLEDWLRQGGASFSEIEEKVSQLLRQAFTFSCFRVDDKGERLMLERRLIGLLAKFPSGMPSASWLGRYAGSAEIRQSGLWNTQHIDGEPPTKEQFGRMLELLDATLTDEHAK